MGLSQMLTKADNGGRGGQANADEGGGVVRRLHGKCTESVQSAGF